MLPQLICLQAETSQPWERTPGTPAQCPQVSLCRRLGPFLVALPKGISWTGTSPPPKKGLGQLPSPLGRSHDHVRTGAKPGKGFYRQGPAWWPANGRCWRRQDRCLIAAPEGTHPADRPLGLGLLASRTVRQCTPIV